MMYFLIIAVLLLLLLQDIFLWTLLLLNFDPYTGVEEVDWPKTTLFIPCRNESDRLEKCLIALENLDYPAEKLQIILGDDQSEDDTLQLLQEWAAGKDNVTVMEITAGDYSKINGKANALSQMAKEATGDFYLYTDADCVLPCTWVKSMTEAWLVSQAGVITGITKVHVKDYWSAMQSLDWWLTLGMVKVMDDIGESMTAMGNNMAMDAKAYKAVGGFEGIPFSLTEDFEIARQIHLKGFDSAHLVSKGNLATTESASSLLELLQQRKRWMSGAMDLPLRWRFILALQVLFFPAIIYFCFLNLLQGLVIWIFKVVMQSIFIYSFAKKTEERLNPLYLFLFEFYYMIISWSTIVFYFWPAKTNWKGRKYK